jgi:hypothetical protein
VVDTLGDEGIRQHSAAMSRDAARLSQFHPLFLRPPAAPESDSRPLRPLRIEARIGSWTVKGR